MIISITNSTLNTFQHNYNSLMSSSKDLINTLERLLKENKELKYLLDE